MARSKSPQPTDAELEILQLLWDQGPSALAAVCDGLRARKPVATTTVSTVLKVMLEKGLVKRTENRAGRGSLWAARHSRKVTSRGMLSRFIDRAFDGSAKRLVAHLIEDGELDDRERDEILRLLRDAGDTDGGRR